ncbi:MAG: hypothetical protein ABL903_08110 [Methylococcales bacterium]
MHKKPQQPEIRPVLPTYSDSERREISAFGQAVIDAMNAHVAVLDRNGDIILANNAWKRFMQATLYDEIY